jgi:hypothetical protein
MEAKKSKCIQETARGAIHLGHMRGRAGRELRMSHHPCPSMGWQKGRRNKFRTDGDEEPLFRHTEHLPCCVRNARLQPNFQGWVYSE